MHARCRTTFWRRTLDLARRRGDWVLVPRFYARTSAVQLVSDITNAHHRSDHTLRIRGLRRDERWEARLEPAEGGAEGDHRVWIRCTDPGVPTDAHFSVLETV